MKSYNMKIANMAPMNKNGCYPFSEMNIGNIPDITIFIEENINKKIKLGCQDVLRRSMNSSNKYRYGEMGLLISTLDNGVALRLRGTYHNVSVNNIDYVNIVNKRKTKDLIFIHNHPNNSTFSYNDVVNLTSTETLRAVIAVGNRHNLFIVTKEDEELVENFEIYVKNKANILSKSDNNRYEIKYYRDVICKQILETCPEKFGLYYEKLRRKQS